MGATPKYIKKPDGKFAGSVGAGITAPTPAHTLTPVPDPAGEPAGPMEALMARLAELPGITVTNADDEWEDQIDRTAVIHLSDPRRAADEGRFGPGAGGFYMEGGRCGRCDSRYCIDGCFAGEPGYVYCVGKGYITFDQADAVEAGWEAQGLRRGVDFGPRHPMRRIEWAA